jgi:mono/diheme cytochrome c family protein
MKYKLMFAVGCLFAGMLASAQGAPAKETWDHSCAKCHGAEGKGDTRIGEKLGVKNYTDPAVQAKFTDEQAFKDIKNGVEVDGRKKMPAFGDKLSDEEIHDLVKHIRSFKKG